MAAAQYVKIMQALHFWGDFAALTSMSLILVPIRQPHEVLAHELGHNFGMNHDFEDVHGGVNGPCNGKGIMSYEHYDYDEWSKCSRSDFEKTFQEQNWGTRCLDDISGLDGCLTNNAGYSCKVPFSYYGKEYYECTKDGASVPWCYDVRGFGNWAYCSNCVQK